MPMCDTVDVVGAKNVRPYDHGRTRKKPGLFAKRFAKAKDWLEGKSTPRGPPEPRRLSSESMYTGPNYQQARMPNQISMSGPLYIPRYNPIADREAPRAHTASSSSYSDSREPDGYHIRAPPPGSYQDDDTGPSPKNLLMAVMGVKSAVNHFAKVLISDMNKYPVDLELLKETIHSEVNSEVDRANHWKFLVQAYICQRLFEGFEAPNGFFGIEYFANDRMTSFISFADFSKFKDKAATISMLLGTDSPDRSFLGRFCFKKFKSISGDLSTNQPLPLYKEEWDVVESQRHPNSVFYQSFLKVAVSVWLLHRLVHSFEQKVEMLTYPGGSKFQRKNMESVVPGGYEEEDEENDVNTEVGFSVIPGFQVSRSVVKCEVYLRNKNRPTDMETTDNKTPVKASSNKTPPAKTLSNNKTPGRLQTTPEMVPSSDPSPEGFKSSSKTSVKTMSNKAPGRLQTPSEMMPSSDPKSSFKTPVKTLSYKTTGRLQTPPSSDPSPEGFKSSSNYADHGVIVKGSEFTTTSAEEAAYRRSVKSGNQETGSRSGRKSRNKQDTVTGEPAHDRAVSTHYIAAPQSSSSTLSWNVARPTMTSERGRLENTRQRPSG